MWLAAVITGGCFGLAGTFLGDWLADIGLPAGVVSHLSLIGMGVSLIMSLFSVKWRDSEA